MDDFELRLKSIALAKPSESMRTRIFGDGPVRLWFAGVFRRRIRLGWAAAFALMTGLAGMSVSQFWSKPASAPPNVLNVQIIRASSSRNPFDFSEPAAEFMPGDITVTVETPKEI